MGYLYESFIQDDKVWDDLIIFNILVFGTVQYTIYLTLKVYEFYKQNGTLF